MIEQAICNSWKREVLEGIHQKSDAYKIALYVADANLSEATTAYTPEGEVQGDGYTKGGKVLTGFVAVLSGRIAFLDFDDAEWPNASCCCRGALIYNASKQNRAVAVWNFGEDVTCTNGMLTCPFPPATASAALIRIRS